MALTIHDQELNTVKQEKKQLELDNSRLRQLGLMIASQREADMDGRTYQDKTTYPKETEGQKLEKSGQYLKDPETEVDTSQPLESRMFDIDPKKHKTQQKQKKIRSIAEEGTTEGERQAGRGKLKDQTQLPKFFKAIIDSKPNPADLLKILQLLPAFTGGGLQMAGGQELRNHLKPYTRGKNSWDTGGGSLQHLTPKERLDLTIGGLERFKV